MSVSRHSTRMDILEKLVSEGFVLRTFPAYERHLAIERDRFVALVEPTPEGALRRFGSAGYLLEGHIALLVEHQGKKRFVFKNKELEAGDDLLIQFARFQTDLDTLLLA